MNNFEGKHKGLYLLARVWKAVIKREDDYIQKALSLEVNPDLIEIKHNGTADYGKIVYVIKENTGSDGFCATLRFILCFLIFAGQHGFVPKIKLTKEFAYYDAEKSKEIPNPWEYYFVPQEENYDEGNALHVCYASYVHRDAVRNAYALNAYRVEDYHDERTIQICAPLIRKYLALKPELIHDANALLEKSRGAGKHILGVHFRGTDYKQGYNKHPVYVDEKQIIAEIQKAVDTGDFSTIFLASDDAAIGERIREAFRDIELLQHPDVYRSDGEQSVAFSESDRKYHHYLLGYEIARDMFTLSLCDGLVAGKSSVVFMSHLYKRSREEDYAYMRIIDNGNYVNGKEYWEQ